MTDLTENLEQFLAAHNEWLLVSSSGTAFGLQNTEIEVETSKNRTLLSFLDDKGFQTWRVRKCEIENGKITFDLARNFEREKETITLVPRVSASVLTAETEIARLETANKIAARLAENFPKMRLVRCALNQENGRLAQIVLQNSGGAQIAVLADVSETLTPEDLLASALFRLRSLGGRSKDPVEAIWILTNKKTRRDLQRLHALLRVSWKKRIIPLGTDEKNQDAAVKIEKLKTLEIEDLWREKPGKIHTAKNIEPSCAARGVMELAPAEIDVLFTRNGETLRFLGLPFARVRKIFGEEKIWFGIEKERRLLNENNLEDFEKLIDDLKTYRSFASPNRRHALYRLAPEAWLEAVLRRNIHLLDANLILSPLHGQFRTAHDRIDLLALRSDGRLVIIELKTAPDREMPFQAIDYWRKIELQRRKGILNEARIFGEKRIADAPALIYLAAPALCFHRDFPFLAGTVSMHLEIYRFDLNNGWRENPRVISRGKVLENGFY